MTDIAKAKTIVKRIKMEELVPHPLNSNVMAADMFQKLKAGIATTGNYSPLVVRQLDPKRYQIIDGHHRYLALAQLGHVEMECQVWDVDEAQANMLLATLNTIHGEQDKEKRAILLKNLVKLMPVPDLKALLPENSRTLVKLLDLTTPAEPIEPVDIPDDKPVMLKVRMFKGQERVLRQAMTAIQERVVGDGAPSCSEGTALEYMAAEWLAGDRLAADAELIAAVKSGEG